MKWINRSRAASFISTSSLISQYFSTTTRPTKSMEIEIKLRLPDSYSHQKLSKILSPFHLETLIQENLFFDTATNQLSKNLAALRLRFYNLNSRSVLSLKAKPVISNGISRVEEQEEPLDPLIGRACVDDPRLLGSISGSKIIKRVKEEFGIGIEELVCLGGFKNVRQVFDWNGLKLEVDETIYDFGTSYEIECETKEPENVKRLIEGLLKDNGVQFSYSDVNKFAVFRSGKLPY
ncbi:hypothetical protein HS088_TW22G00637 [Tripterygium wilfordii]|uniref:CYTH domain-containing protein n=1 Tax=Tripterygium wilfordii TaxID=458696 RepID=A0A7J7BYM0_TRIWF|nr:triphosphate tunnel metalloenzyme 3-like [Tripterygium wilfordii]KAF5726952.1 hypothetical protein HS088_TW22G00637 [Tripterygium wilfordii]